MSLNRNNVMRKQFLLFYCFSGQIQTTNYQAEDVVYRGSVHND